jgi:type IV secretory pathway VirB6-like protein
LWDRVKLIIHLFFAITFNYFSFWLQSSINYVVSPTIPLT